MCYNLPMKRLRSEKPEEILKYLEEVQKNISKLKKEERMENMESIFSLFYLDLFDKPQFEKVVLKAMDILKEMGQYEDCLKWLCSQLSETDLKASLNLARLLGSIGEKAIPHLIEVYKTSENPYARIMAIHSLGKIKEKEVLKYLELIKETLSSKDDELRDTGVRTLGKFFENFKLQDFKKEEIQNLFEELLKLISDIKAPVRAKAFRTLGKMAKNNFLEKEQKEKLKNLCLKALGKTNFQWDNAYIVRAEAEETLKILDK